MGDEFQRRLWGFRTVYLLFGLAVIFFRILPIPAWIMLAIWFAWALPILDVYREQYIGPWLLAIAALAGRYERFGGIDLAERVGQHRATLCGFERSGGAIVVTMDDE